MAIIPEGGDMPEGAMTNLKAHTPTAADLNPVDADRGESGAGIIVAVLACLLVLGLLAGGSVVGLVFYVGHQRQLQEERARMMAVAKLEQIQAEATTVAAEQAAKMAEERAIFAEIQALESPAAGPAEVAPAESPPPAPTPEERFESEIAPLNAAVAERPDDPQPWLERARALQRWRKWKEAAENYERFLEFKPQNIWIRQDAALMRFAVGERDAYLAHCRAMEAGLATRTQPSGEHNRAARILSLAPGALTSGDSLLIMVQHEPLKNPGKWWLLEPMAALQYRTGRYDEALKTIDELRPLAGFSGQRAATEIWAAMTLHQLGRADEARQALAAAQEHVAGGLPPPGGGNAGGDAVVIALFMMDEARGLVEGPASPANNGEN
jgi:tetratricopeptide (TPR) repeat protein